MIRKLRLKFVVVCMAMVTAVLAVVCFAIFAALRGNVADLSREVLHRVIQEEALSGEGRVLVRPSGTEALMRVMVEAKTVRQADECAGRLADLVKTLKI